MNVHSNGNTFITTFIVFINFIVEAEIFSMRERYAMPTLDTAYIRSQYRNRGFGIEILLDIIERFPNEDIGFSKPISEGMWRGKRII